MIKNANASFPGDKLQNQFTAYVERALKNYRISYYRKNKDRSNTELFFSSENAMEAHMMFKSSSSIDTTAKESLHPDFIQHEGLAEELRSISEKDLTIIRLRIANGYTYKRIASILGMKEEAVRVRYFRSIQKIRDNLKGETK